MIEMAFNCTTTRFSKACQIIQAARCHTILKAMLFGETQIPCDSGDLEILECTCVDAMDLNIFIALKTLEISHLYILQWQHR